MTRAGDWPGVETGGLAQGMGDRYPLQGRHVCPFCGSINETVEGPCPHCTMSNTAETRKATKSRIGPWYVLQSRNPAAPGMRYDTLLGFVRKGRVKARSIVRGPTTHQLWRFACQVKGLGREFGLCFSCGGSVERDAQLCPQCNRLQDPPADPDVFIEGQAAAAAETIQSAVQMGAADMTATPMPAAPVAAPAGPVAAMAEATQDVRRSPIFKDLNVPAAPAAMPSPAAPAAAPAMDSGDAFFTRPAPAPSVPPVFPTAGAPGPTAKPPAPTVPPHSAAPAAARGPQKRNAGDVFLSAKDLAAAFQLGFDGKADDRADPSFDPAAPWAAEAAPVASLRPAPPRRRKRRKGRVALALLLLAAGGFGAYLAVDAAARERVVGWGRAKYAALTGADLYPDLSGAGFGAATTATAAVEPSNDGRGPNGREDLASVLPRAATRPGREDSDLSQAPDGGGADADSTAVPTAVPAEAPRTRPVIPSGERADVPVREDVPEQGDRSARPIGSAGPVVSARADAPVARPPTPQTKPAAATQPALTREEAVKKSRELYNQALDAEERGDYRKARSLYEQIMKTLPADTWYQGIETRLRIAKEMLGEK